MNIRKILSLAFAATLLFTTSCTNDSTEEVVETTYDKGILIMNEGGFTTPTAEVSFVTDDLSLVANKIYTGKNKEILGNVLQTIGFSDGNAYLVSNVPNKIDIVNRYTFKQQATVTTNLQGPRYIAFSGNQYYVTNNLSGATKLNVYNKDNTFVKSITFDRYAEKVVEASGTIIVQTDGITYEANPPYNALPTGYTITTVKPSTNTVDKTITLPTVGIIRDMISYNGDAYVLASDNTNSYIYKINSTAGTYTTTTLTAIPQVQKLRADNNKFYFANASNKIYSMTVGSTTVPTAPIVTTPGNLYGFNVIDGRIFASDASFTADSKVNVYNATSGSLLKTFTAGIGTSGFFKN